jgi:hypothetical protein
LKAVPFDHLEHLMLDGKVLRASYNSGVINHFVHLLHLKPSPYQPFVIGVNPTEKGKHGEWGAGISLIQSILPLSENRSFMVSGDAGFCVEAASEWIHLNGGFYFWKIKENCGAIYDRVVQWAQLAEEKRTEGDYQEIRKSSKRIDLRKLWRLPGLQHSNYPGISEAFYIKKQRVHLPEATTEKQLYITNFQQHAWSAKQVMDRALMHWEVETGCFGRKDRHFSEDLIRFHSKQKAWGHSSMIAWVFNCLYAPKLKKCFPENASIPVKMQLLKDKPQINPFDSS